MMKDLAVGDGVVSVLAKMGVERRDAGSILLGPRLIVHEAMTGRTNAGHQAGPRSTAGGHHAVGSLEDDALGRQPVDVRTVHLFVAVAAKLGSQIIHGDEEDVGALVSRPGCCSGKERNHQEGEGSAHRGGPCCCGYLVEAFGTIVVPQRPSGKIVVSKDSNALGCQVHTVKDAQPALLCRILVIFIIEVDGKLNVTVFLYPRPILRRCQPHVQRPS